MISNLNTYLLKVVLKILRVYFEPIDLVHIYSTNMLYTIEIIGLELGFTFHILDPPILVYYVK